MATLELTIDRIVAGGKGLGFVRGQAVFVPWTAPGDRVQAQVTLQAKDYLEADPVCILEPGPDRIPPACPVYGQCGGCRLLHLNPPGNRRAKTGIIRDALRRIGRLEPELGPWLPGEAYFGYRCRAGLKLRWIEETQQAVVGFYRPASHWVVDIPTCPILHPSLQELPEQLRRILPELEARDHLPQVDILASEAGIGMVWHFLEPPSSRDQERLLAFARQQNPAQLRIQIGRKKEMITLVDRASLHYTVDGLTLCFEPGDFTQANFEGNQTLVAEAMTLAGSGEGAMDLFCGIGNFTLPMARRWQRVLGVEGYAPALTRARANAKHHGMNHIRWQETNLFRPNQAEFLPRSGMTVALLDPPREGAASVCKFLVGSQVAKVVYVSCNPVSFARDATILHHGGWHLASLRPAEMFPGTPHVELLAHFQRE